MGSQTGVNLEYVLKSSHTFYLACVREVIIITRLQDCLWINVQVNVNTLSVFSLSKKTLCSRMLSPWCSGSWCMGTEVTARWAWMEAFKTVSPNKSCHPCYLKYFVTVAKPIASCDECSKSDCWNPGLASVLCHTTLLSSLRCPSVPF